MLFVANNRGGGRQLAHHLMKQENDHITIHDMRGFAGHTLDAAFRETYAISRATKCEKYLFSLSLNPPMEASVPTDVFEQTIERVEKEFGLSGQPRALVFHEKDGRRHAHCVWSRIDVNEMKAIKIPYYKNRLMDISRELFVEHGWKMPAGMIDRAQKNPLNYSLEEYQQAKRAGYNPKELKFWFQQCWQGKRLKGGFCCGPRRARLFSLSGRPKRICCP